MSIYIGGPEGLTWEGARAKVRGDLWRPGTSLPDDVVDRALHASVLNLEGECKWLWLEEVTMIASLDEPAYFIGLPPTVGRVSSVGVQRDTGVDELDELPLVAVRDFADADIGDPTAWALGDGQVWLDCQTAAGTTFELIITAQTPEALEDALASPCATLQRHQQAVIAGACAIVALGFMKNADEAERQQAIADKIISRMQDVEADRRGGMIQADTWGMGYHG